MSVEHSMYDREFEERERIINSCHFDPYVKSSIPRWGYPYRQMSYNDTRQSVADSSQHTIIGSTYRSIGDTDYLIRSAERVDADYVMPPDVTSKTDADVVMNPGEEELDPEWKVNPRLFREFKQAYETRDHDATAEVMIPLHPPFDWFLDELSAEIDAGHPVVVAGFDLLDVDERIGALRTIRDRVGPDTHIHVLRPGTSMEMMEFLRQNPGVADSLCLSTPERAPINGKMPDMTWIHHRHLFPKGTDSSTIRSSAARYLVLKWNYMLGDLCGEKTFQEMKTEIQKRQTDAYIVREAAREVEDGSLQHYLYKYAREHESAPDEW